TTSVCDDNSIIYLPPANIEFTCWQLSTLNKFSGRFFSSANDEGKSNSTHSSFFIAVNLPLLVLKFAGSSAFKVFSCQRMCALAKVAWPQRSISTVGVNQRKLNSFPFFCTKAVSDKLF